MKPHANRYNADCRKRYWARRNSGKCSVCGSNPPREGLTTCEACGKRQSAHSKKMRRRMVPACRELKICIICLRRAAVDGRKWCAVCAERHTENQRAMAYRRIAAGLCRRCGVPMDREGTSCKACCAKAVIANRKRRKKLREAA